MTSTTDHKQHLAPERTRVETIGDGISSAALISTWLGATVPLLPAVALLIALAGRKRSLTRWLNTLAIVVSAIFLAAQVVLVLAFGGLIATAVTNLTDRTGGETTLTAPLDEDSFTVPDSSSETDPSSATPASGSAVSVLPGTDPTLDGSYQDVLGSAFEETGFATSDFANEDLLGAATTTCSTLDDGGDFETASNAVNNAYPIPRAVAGSVAASAVSVYCPIYTELVLSGPSSD